MAEKINVCIVGSGNWGSAIAKIVGANAARLPEFEDRVTMYVYEEIIDGKKLTEIINTSHENIKYLPGHKLPPNVIAVPDLVEAAKDADIFIFVVPHQFIPNFCKTLLGKIKPNAIAISLIKGFDKAEGGGIDLISHIITRHLKIPCSVLMGANLANEVAEEHFCETTIGCRDSKYAKTLRDLFQASHFRVVVVDDADAVEVCGALKNIVACGAGFVDGLTLGDNTKAAVIRLGLMEMIRFVDIFYPGSKLSTFFESCGVADLITTCYGGRNRKVAEAFVKTGKTIEQLETEMLNGQKLQGPPTAEEVNYMLKNKGLEEKFPLFTAIHKICTNTLKPQELIDCIRNHPEHMTDIKLLNSKPIEEMAPIPESIPQSANKTSDLVPQPVTTISEAFAKPARKVKRRKFRLIKTARKSDTKLDSTTIPKQSDSKSSKGVNILDILDTSTPKHPFGENKGSDGDPKPCTEAKTITHHNIWSLTEPKKSTEDTDSKPKKPDSDLKLPKDLKNLFANSKMGIEKKTLQDAFKPVKEAKILEILDSVPAKAKKIDFRLTPILNEKKSNESTGKSTSTLVMKTPKLENEDANKSTSAFSYIKKSESIISEKSPSQNTEAKNPFVPIISVSKKSLDFPWRLGQTINKKMTAPNPSKQEDGDTKLATESEKADHVAKSSAATELIQEIEQSKLADAKQSIKTTNLGDAMQTQTTVGEEPIFLPLKQSKETEEKTALNHKSNFDTPLNIEENHLESETNFATKSIKEEELSKLSDSISRQGLEVKKLDDDVKTQENKLSNKAIAIKLIKKTKKLTGPNPQIITFEARPNIEKNKLENEIGNASKHMEAEKLDYYSLSTSKATIQNNEPNPKYLNIGMHSSIEEEKEKVLEKTSEPIIKANKLNVDVAPTAVTDPIKIDNTPKRIVYAQKIDLSPRPESDLDPVLSFLEKKKDKFMDAVSELEMEETKLNFTKNRIPETMNIYNVWPLSDIYKFYFDPNSITEQSKSALENKVESKMNESVSSVWPMEKENALDFMLDSGTETNKWKSAPEPANEAKSFDDTQQLKVAEPVAEENKLSADPEPANDSNKASETSKLKTEAMKNMNVWPLTEIYKFYFDQDSVNEQRKSEFRKKLESALKLEKPTSIESNVGPSEADNNLNVGQGSDTKSIDSKTLDKSLHMQIEAHQLNKEENISNIEKEQIAEVNKLDSTPEQTIEAKIAAEAPKLEILHKNVVWPLSEVYQFFSDTETAIGKKKSDLGNKLKSVLKLEEGKETVIEKKKSGLGSKLKSVLKREKDPSTVIVRSDIAAEAPESAIEKKTLDEAQEQKMEENEKYIDWPLTEGNKLVLEKARNLELSLQDSAPKLTSEVKATSDASVKELETTKIYNILPFFQEKRFYFESNPIPEVLRLELKNKYGLTTPKLDSKTINTNNVLPLTKEYKFYNQDTIQILEKEEDKLDNVLTFMEKTNLDFKPDSVLENNKLDAALESANEIKMAGETPKLKSEKSNSATERNFEYNPNTETSFNVTEPPSQDSNQTISLVENKLNLSSHRTIESILENALKSINEVKEIDVTSTLKNKPDTKVIKEDESSKISDLISREILDNKPSMPMHANTFDNTLKSSKEMNKVFIPKTTTLQPTIAESKSINQILPAAKPIKEEDLSKISDYISSQGVAAKELDFSPIAPLNDKIFDVTVNTSKETEKTTVVNQTNISIDTHSTIDEMGNAFKPTKIDNIAEEITNAEKINFSSIPESLEYFLPEENEISSELFIKENILDSAAELKSAESLLDFIHEEMLKVNREDAALKLETEATNIRTDFEKINYYFDPNSVQEQTLELKSEPESMLNLKTDVQLVDEVKTLDLSPDLETKVIKQDPEPAIEAAKLETKAKEESNLNFEQDATTEAYKVSSAQEPVIEVNMAGEPAELRDQSNNIDIFMHLTEENKADFELAPGAELSELLSTPEPTMEIKTVEENLNIASNLMEGSNLVLEKSLDPAPMLATEVTPADEAPKLELETTNTYNVQTSTEEDKFYFGSNPATELKKFELENSLESSQQNLETDAFETRNLWPLTEENNLHFMSDAVLENKNLNFDPDMEIKSFEATTELIKEPNTDSIESPLIDENKIDFEEIKLDFMTDTELEASKLESPAELASELVLTGEDSKLEMQPANIYNIRPSTEENKFIFDQDTLTDKLKSELKENFALSSELETELTDILKLGVEELSSKFETEAKNINYVLPLTEEKKIFFDPSPAIEQKESKIERKLESKPELKKEADLNEKLTPEVKITDKDLKLEKDKMKTYKAPPSSKPKKIYDDQSQLLTVLKLGLGKKLSLSTSLDSEAININNFWPSENKFCFDPNPQLTEVLKLGLEAKLEYAARLEKDKLNINEEFQFREEHEQYFNPDQVKELKKFQMKNTFESNYKLDAEEYNKNIDRHLIKQNKLDFDPDHKITYAKKLDLSQKQGMEELNIYKVELLTEENNQVSGAKKSGTLLEQKETVDGVFGLSINEDRKEKIEMPKPETEATNANLFESLAEANKIITELSLEEKKLEAMNVNNIWPLLEENEFNFDAEPKTAELKTAELKTADTKPRQVAEVEKQDIEEVINKNKFWPLNEVAFSTAPKPAKEEVSDTEITIKKLRPRHRGHKREKRDTRPNCQNFGKHFHSVFGNEKKINNPGKSKSNATKPSDLSMTFSSKYHTKAKDPTKDLLSAMIHNKKWPINHHINKKIRITDSCNNAMPRYGIGIYLLPSRTMTTFDVGIMTTIWALKLHHRGLGQDFQFATKASKKLDVIKTINTNSKQSEVKALATISDTKKSAEKILNICGKPERWETKPNCSTKDTDFNDKLPSNNSLKSNERQVYGRPIKKMQTKPSRKIEKADGKKTKIDCKKDKNDSKKLKRKTNCGNKSRAKAAAAIAQQSKCKLYTSHMNTTTTTWEKPILLQNPIFDSGPKYHQINNKYSNWARDSKFLNLLISRAELRKSLNANTTMRAINVGLLMAICALKYKW